MRLLFIVVSHVWMAMVAADSEVFYIIPENSTISTCPSQPCSTMSQYLLNNSLTPAVSNLKMYLLPGKHHLITNIEMWNLSNVSLIGISNHTSSLVVLECLSKSHIAFYGSHNVTITNMVFNQCDSKINFTTRHIKQSQANVRAGLFLYDCSLCKLQNIIFRGFGIIGVNLIGKSYLNNITVNLYIATPNFDYDVCTSAILFVYTNSNSNIYYTHNDIEVLAMDNLIISGNSVNCRISNLHSAMEVHLQQSFYGVTIRLCNSEVHYMDHTVLSVINVAYAVRNTLWIKNCTFTHIEYSPIFDYIMITIATLNINATIFFVNCSFTLNMYMESLIAVNVKEAEIACNDVCAYAVTNLSFVNCNFIKNVAPLMYVKGKKETKYMANIFMESSNICGNIATLEAPNPDIIFLSYVAVYMNGMINMSNNFAMRTILACSYCKLTFTKTAIFSYNNCNQVISLVSNLLYIQLVGFVSITFVNNTYKYVIISIDEYYNKPYQLCVFQYITNQSTFSATSYSISITDSFFYDHQNFYFLLQYLSHCKWLPTAMHHSFNPGTLNRHIIQVNNQPWHHQKRICHCPRVGYSNCTIDVLGPIYPGQVLQLQLCIPGAEEVYIMYAETFANSLPNSTCRIANQAELINDIGSIPRIINFTIIYESYKQCELFITAQPYIYEYYDAFYVQLLPCPVGFTLQNGACKCDPLLPSKIEVCFIDYSAIQRPADTWIIALTQVNSTKYSISDCPMDYCLPYSSYVNLLHPDEQCQFKRAGILCSQCQHPLSMVFGSSRCMECTNLHILITIIVIVAGIVLVVSLYLLNLTVTIGTINGIILYANIISINDSVFLVNDNVFKPLKVFISFVNLDLGIETCFYNGMDSYAKMWLQLFFPFYLIIIAALIITSSRYYSRILRLTFTRSLPVLATLFLLSYTGVLRTVLTVLFSYSTITHLPSGHRQIVWSIDASVPLFGLRFTILFITCVLLFILLIPFNIILLFTRHLLRFRVINRFKPLLDAFQGSYKDKYYYMIAMYIVIRSLFFALYAFQNMKLKLIVATVILVLFTGYHGYTHPNKNKFINIQELLLVANLTILYVVSYHTNSRLFYIASNVLISLAFFQFCIIVLYHFLTYTCQYNIVAVMKTIKEKVRGRERFDNQRRFVELLNIPERTHKYDEFQDGLITDDFVQNNI